MRSLPPDLSPQEIIARLSEFGPVTELGPNEAIGQRRTIARGLLHLISSNLMTLAKSGRRGRGTSEDVAAIYEQSYSSPITDLIDLFNREQKGRLFRIGPHAVAKVDPRSFVGFMRTFLGDIVAGCEPSSICEVGCGMGGNLFYLANRLNAVKCAGFDIAENAIKGAAELQVIDNLPLTAYGRIFGLVDDPRENVKHIDFRTGSAFSLPVADKSYDLVFTSAALEQMQWNIDKALSELRRIARSYVLMMEPFADGNDVLGRIFLWSRNYFRMHAADLPKFGLEPIRVWTKVPSKPTFTYSFVLCRVKE